MNIKHWFIPNRKNGFHPVVLRSTGLMLFAVLFLSIPILYNAISVNQLKVLGYATNISVDDLFNLSNQERSSVGVNQLRLNPNLIMAAQAKAQDMMTNNYWSHISPSGTTPWHFINESGYIYASAGENLAKDFTLSSGVVAGWMDSPLHRDNVLNPTYQDVGYAILNGSLQGSDTTLVVALYGTPMQLSATPPADFASTQQSTTSYINTPSPTKTQDIIARGLSSTTDYGDVNGISSYLSIQRYNAMNWGQKASIMLLLALILLFIMKHTAIWRERKNGLKHIWLRSHPLGQAIVLSVIMVATVLSGVGVIL